MMDFGEEEYESDPEQAKLSLKMRRRREASDDEEEDDDGRGRERRIDSRVSDYESDGQGAAAEYDDEESELVEEEADEELLEEIEEEEEEFGEHCGGSDAQGLGAQVVGKDMVGGVIEGGALGDQKEDEQTDGDGFDVQDNVDKIGDNVNGSGEGQGQEEKKENEPFAVPTAGAFYMHDDRFRDSAGGRHRRTLGGRKLWELRDDRKWGHDKFEEMTMQERRYDEGRRVSRGRNQARGRNKGEDHRYSQVHMPKAYDSNNQGSAPKSVRGRGPRRYQPSAKSNIEACAPNRRPVKSVEKVSHVSSGRASAATSTSESTQVPSRKNVFASSLSSASPPFYPSGSSNKEINLTQKRDAQTGQINRKVRPHVIGETYPISQSNNMRGKSVSDSLGMDKLYIDDSVSSNSRKHLNNLPLPTSGPSFINPTHPLQARDKERGQTPLGQIAYQPAPPHNLVIRVPSPNQVHAFQRAPVQNRLEPNFHPSGQQLGSHSVSGSQASSPPTASGPIHLLESTELASPLESNNSKTALVGKGKGGIQTSGMNSFPYAGAQVMATSGSIGGNHGDQNFPGTPAFLPVMQFAGQHPGGIGVPAVGMAFPGYVAQPNGMGNSEMTWLPVLAGAAGALGASGALGATYCSPYITMDGAYHARTSEQASSLAPASSKDSDMNKPGNDVKPSQRSELANDELGQRQNKARRYTEMKFDQ